MVRFNIAATAMGRKKHSSENYIGHSHRSRDKWKWSGRSRHTATQCSVAIKRAWRYVHADAMCVHSCCCNSGKLKARAVTQGVKITHVTIQCELEPCDQANEEFHFSGASDEHAKENGHGDENANGHS